VDLRDETKANPSPRGGPAARFLFAAATVALAAAAGGVGWMRMIHQAEVVGPEAPYEEASGRPLPKDARAGIQKAQEEYDGSVRALRAALGSTFAERLNVPSDVALAALKEHPEWLFEEDFAIKLRSRVEALTGQALKPEEIARLEDLDADRVRSIKNIQLRRIDKIAAATGMDRVGVVSVLMRNGSLKAR